MSDSESDDFQSLPSENNADQSGQSSSVTNSDGNQATNTAETTAVAMVDCDNNILTAQDIDSILPFGDLFDDDLTCEVNDHDSKYETFIINPEIAAMGSTIADTLLCPVCKKQFCLESGDPRDLKCGHTVCSTCLHDLFISSEIECPECKQKFLYNSIDEVPVSFTIKQIIQTYSEKKVELENPKTFNQKLKILGEDDEPSIVGETGTCKDHSMPIEFGCTTCEQWLCGTCVCLEHSGFRRSNCRVYPIHIALENKKKQTLADLSKKIEKFEKLLADGQDIDTSIDRLLQVMRKESKLFQLIIDRFKQKEELYSKEKEYLQNCTGKISRILNMFSAAKTPVEMKAAIDFYFENKSFIHKEAEKNDLFDVWRQCVSEVDQFWKENESFYVKWPEVSPNGWAEVTLKTRIAGIIVKLPDLDPEKDLQNAIIMEVPFFDISSYIYYPFLCIDKTQRQLGSVTFTVDESPLARIFLRRCGSIKNLFNGCVMKFLNTDLHLLTFGERQYKSPKKLEKIGDPNRYRKPFSLGAIGVIGKVENEDSIDVNNMNFYVNLEDDPPKNADVSFISTDSENGDCYLSLCFGEVYEMIEVLKDVDPSSQERLTISQSGITVDAQEESDSE